MPWYAKHETFTPSAAALPIEQRRPHLEAHRRWVDQQAEQGRSIRSGFLVDSSRRPGGGGLLIFEADCYADALSLVKQDPMIEAGLVSWSLQEWIPVSGDGWP